MVKRTFSAPSRPLSARAAVAAVVAAAAVAGVLALARDAGVPPSTPTASIAVSASLTPAIVEFGDRLAARLVIELDRAAVRAQTLRFTEGLAPLTQLGPAVSSRVISGNLELVTVETPVACLTSGCVSRSGVATVHLPAVSATVLRARGSTLTTARPWPALRVRGRVRPADLATSPPAFAAETAPPAPSYRVSPATLAAVLDVLAALCALAAVALAARGLLRSRLPRQRRRVDGLERALRLTRQAEALPVPDRRRALGLLARLLARDRLSTRANELAWSEHQPEPDELEALVSEIERGTRRQ